MSWCFTKRRYIKCMYLYLLMIADLHWLAAGKLLLVSIWSIHFFPGETWTAFPAVVRHGSWLACQCGITVHEGTTLSLCTAWLFQQRVTEVMRSIKRHRPVLNRTSMLQKKCYPLNHGVCDIDIYVCEIGLISKSRSQMHVTQQTAWASDIHKLRW